MARHRKATLYIEVQHQGLMRPVRFEKEVPTGVRVGSFYLRYRQPDGKRKWENVGTELNVALREQKARQESVKNASLAPTAVRTSLASAITTYLKDVQTVLGTKAHKRTSHLLEEFSRFAKKSPLDEITRDTLMEFQRHLLAKGAAAKTIRDRLQVRSQHCVHEAEFMDMSRKLVLEFSQEVAKDVHSEFKLRYQLAEKSPSGNPTLYLEEREEEDRESMLPSDRWRQPRDE